MKCVLSIKVFDSKNHIRRGKRSKFYKRLWSLVRLGGVTPPYGHPDRKIPVFYRFPYHILGEITTFGELQCLGECLLLGSNAMAVITLQVCVYDTVLISTLLQ